MKIRISHPELVAALVRDLNETDCFAAATGPDALDVFLPWLELGGDAVHGRAELLFYVKAWGAGHAGFRAQVG